MVNKWQLYSTVLGIPATCQDYLSEGYTTSHTYLIDPDGPYAENSGMRISIHCIKKFQVWLILERKSFATQLLPYALRLQIKDIFLTRCVDESRTLPHFHWLDKPVILLNITLQTSHIETFASGHISNCKWYPAISPV